jgi:hypothetical protein
MSITRRLRTKTGKVRRHTHSATCKHKRTRSKHSKRKSMRSKHKRTYKKMSGGLIVF